MHFFAITARQQHQLGILLSLLREMRSAVNPGFHLPYRLDCPSPSRLKMFSGNAGQSNGNNADAKWDDPDEICNQRRNQLYSTPEEKTSIFNEHY